MNTIRSVFVTGATGILGARIISDLLHNTSFLVYCLIRAKSQKEAFERLRQAVGVYVEGDISELLAERTVAIPGNAEMQGLGIEPSVRSALDIDIVIHTAASVNLAALYPLLRKPNVVATENAAQFSLDRQAPIVYVSTHGILGMKAFEPGFVFRETDFDVGQEFRHFHYAKSKFDAETIVRQYSERGLRTLIVRPGDIFGDSETGAYPLATRHGADVFYDIFRTTTDLGLTMFSEDYFDITPVDYVAKAIVALMQDRDCFGKTFHLTNPDRKKFYEVMNFLVDYGYRMRFMTYLEYLEKFRKGKVLREGKKYRSNFLSLLHYFESFFRGESICAKFDTTDTEATLQQKGVHCAPINLELIKTYMDYAVRAGYMAAPDQQVLAEYTREPAYGLPRRLFRRAGLYKV